MGKRYWESLEGNFKAGHVEDAFGVYYSRNVQFSAEVGNPNIIYYESYKEEEKEVNLDKLPNEQEKPKENPKAEVKEEYVDTDL